MSCLVYTVYINPKWRKIVEQKKIWSESVIYRKALRRKKNLLKVVLGVGVFISFIVVDMFKSLYKVCLIMVTS